MVVHGDEKRAAVVKTQAVVVMELELVLVVVVVVVEAVCRPVSYT